MKRILFKYNLSWWAIFVAAILFVAATACEPQTPSGPPSGTSVPTTAPVPGETVLGPSGGDDTARLVQAVQANPHVVIEQPLKIDNVAAFGAISNKTITFRSNGKLIRSIQPNLVTYQILLFTGSKNITLNNPQIIGANSTCRYSALFESQHAISLEGVDNFEINGGLVKNVGGDGLYFVNKYNAIPHQPTTNVQINNFSTLCTGRNSISNISSQYITINGGTFDKAGLWIFNIEPFNALYVKDYTINNPTVGYSTSSWLFASGPYYSCVVERVVINKPVFLVTPFSATINQCIRSQIKINY